MNFRHEFKTGNHNTHRQNIDNMLFDNDLSNFLNLSPQTKESKEKKNRQWDPSKLKTFFTVKEIPTKPSEWKKIFANDSSKRS